MTFASLTFRWSVEPHGSVWQDEACEIRFKESHPHCCLKNNVDETPRASQSRLLTNATAAREDSARFDFHYFTSSFLAEI